MSNLDLPVSESSEKGLLGSLLLAPETVSEICQLRKVSEDWFHSHTDYPVIFRGINEMVRLKLPVDFITATHFFEEKRKGFVLAAEQGDALITDLFTFVPTATNASYYIDILQETQARRMAIIACDISKRGLMQSHSLQEVFDITTKAFSEVHQLCEKEEAVDHDKDNLMAFIKEMEECQEGSTPNLLKFGFPSIDNATGGPARGEVILIHAPTSCFKSVTGQNIVEHNVFEHGKRAVIYSVEMLHKQYLRRITASRGSISLTAMRRGRFGQGEFNRFSNTVARIASAPISIYDVNRISMTPESIIASLRREKKNKGVDIALIDYLQLLQFSKKKSDNRRDQDLQYFSSSLKQLAMELDMVIILIAQAGVTGAVFDATQVASDVDWEFAMIPEYSKEKVPKILGVKGLFIKKAREGERGIMIPMTTEGQFARIRETEKKVS